MLGSEIENRNRKTESLGAGFWLGDSDYDVPAVFLLAVFIESRIQSARLIKRSPLWTHALVVEVQCRSVPAKSPRDSRRRNTPSPLTRFCRVSALHCRPASRRSVSSTLPLFDRLPQVRLRDAVTSSHVAQLCPGRTGVRLCSSNHSLCFSVAPCVRHTRCGSLPVHICWPFPRRFRRRRVPVFPFAPIEARGRLRQAISAGPGKWRRAPLFAWSMRVTR